MPTFRIVKRIPLFPEGFRTEIVASGLTFEEAANQSITFASDDELIPEDSLIIEEEGES